MNIRVKRLAIAGAVSVAVSVAAIPTAQADAILFPYVVSSTTVTTIMSVANHGLASTLSGTAKRTDLHYENWHKNSHNTPYDPNDSELGCVEFDYTVPTTPEDLVTFSADDAFGAPNNVLHNDDTDYDDFDFGLWEPVGPTRGFTIVDDLINNFDGELYGEAMVYEIANGAAWGYIAFNSQHVLFAEPQFHNSLEVRGEVIRQDGIASMLGNENAPIIFQPLNEWTTTFLVTPVGTSTQRFGAFAVGVDLAANSNGLPIVAFDRDESPVSGSTPVNVVCVARIDVQDLISDGIENLLQDGGWTFFEVVPHTITGAPATSTDGQAVQPGDGAIAYKLEFNGTGVTTFNGETIPGTVNTANQLRYEISTSALGVQRFWRP